MHSPHFWVQVFSVWFHRDATRVKKSQICPICGQSEPIWGPVRHACLVVAVSERRKKLLGSVEIVKIKIQLLCSRHIPIICCRFFFFKNFFFKGRFYLILNVINIYLCSYLNYESIRTKYSIQYDFMCSFCFPEYSFIINFKINC